MITEATMYGIQCDGCKQIFEDSDGYLVYDREEDIESAIIDANWIKVRDKHYCEKCYRYGDNDELILADGVVIPFHDDDWQ